MSDQLTALSTDNGDVGVSSVPQSGTQLATNLIPKSGTVYEYKVVESGGLKIVTIKTLNTEIRQISVREIGDGKSERGYRYSAGTATVYLTNAHIVGQLIPALKVDVVSGVEYNPDIDPTKLSNCTSFWFDALNFPLTPGV